MTRGEISRGKPGLARAAPGSLRCELQSVSHYRIGDRLRSAQPPDARIARCRRKPRLTPITSLRRGKLLNRTCCEQTATRRGAAEKVGGLSDIPRSLPAE